jgi:hypothetical protein
MTQPDGRQVEAAIHALRGEAALWDDLANQVLAMSGTAANLTLTSFDFSGLGHLAGVDTLYTDLQQRITDLLTQAMHNFVSTALALDNAAEGYERDEQNAVHRMRDVY